MKKTSAKLDALMTSERPDQAVPLHVMLSRDLPPRTARAVVQELTRFATSPRQVDYLPASGIVVFPVRMDRIADIARLPEVTWIDLDSEAPLEELLDHD
jgi:hypothetical protein